MRLSILVLLILASTIFVVTTLIVEGIVKINSRELCMIPQIVLKASFPDVISVPDLSSFKLCLYLLLLPGTRCHETNSLNDKFYQL